MYLIMTMIALTIGFQVYQVIEASIGTSVNLDEIVRGFDYTIWCDFLNIHGASLSPLFGQLRWHILIFLIMSIFMHGGILSNIRLDHVRWTKFWSGGARNFYPFTVIGIFYSIVMLLWTIVIWAPFFINLFTLIERFDRESPIIWMLCVLAIIWIVGLGFVYASSLHSRLRYLDNDTKIWTSIQFGMGYSFRRFWKILIILALFFFSLLLVYLMNHSLEIGLTISTPWLIFLFLVIQQMFILAKIFLRVASMASFNSLLDE